jgi:hypothetical protein
MGNTIEGGALDNLLKGIESMATTDGWKDYLNFQSHFHDYSFGNVMLIRSQRPNATYVAGFKTWVKLNRRVKKGEKAIWIKAPVISYHDGELLGYKYVPVFDVSQTDGGQLPSICKLLDQESSPEIYKQLSAIVNDLGFVILEMQLEDGLNGDCSHELKQIRINNDNFLAQKTKTLCHELAHLLLHENAQDRALAELEAESVAYIVCKHLGIEAGEYSFGYVLSWAGSSEDAQKTIKASGEKIQKCAQFIIKQQEKLHAKSKSGFFGAA